MQRLLRLLAVVFAVSAGLACGRTELFSARRGSCPPTDPTCQVRIDGGVDGGPGTDGAQDRRTDGGGDRMVCPTGTREICGNGRDDDCNGLSDCADPVCFGDPACIKVGHEVCNNGLDDDADGLVDCADPDCMASVACRPNMGKEICDNGVDDNGDRLVDCSDPQCTSTFPGCLTLACTADVDFGALAAHGARVSRDIDTRGAPRGYATCAPSGGHGRVGRFSLSQAADVRVDFSQRPGGAHVVALFRAGGAEACDRNPVQCLPFGAGATATDTFKGLSPGVYWLIVESYPSTEGQSTVVLSTGNVSMPEVCGNGIDDDGNGLVDCQDVACRTAASCPHCAADVNVGALVVGDAPKVVNVDLRNAPDRYRPTCAGMVPGGDQAIALTLPAAGGIEVQFQQTGHTIFSLFRDPGPGLACDADQVGCTFEEVRASALAFTEQPAGAYILIVKADGNAQAGTLVLRISAFANRGVEVCGNNIDDDANGLTDCDDPACFGLGACAGGACVPDFNVGSLAPGMTRSVMLDTRSAHNVWQTSCGRGNGKEQVVRVTLTQPMALGIDCTQTGSHVFELAQQLSPLDGCTANEVGCADPSVLPFGCGYAIPGLQPGTYNVIVEAFQAGTEGTVALTLVGERETVREICDNGVDDDGDGATDCADLKCVTSATCQKFACRADQSVGLLPLDGSPSSVVVQTTMGGDDQTHTSCASAPGGQDGDVDFQLPSKADLTLTWAQFGNHDFALYSDEGALLSCEAGQAFACVASSGQSAGTQVIPGLPAGRYHLVVDANAPGSEGAVALQLSAVASP